MYNVCIRDEGSIREDEKDFPYVLKKACHDPFDYFIQLKNGATFRFKKAHSESSEWVTISDIDECSTDALKCIGGEVSLDRGVQIRVSEIALIIDAPFGS